MGTKITYFMNSKLKYTDYIAHYKTDAELNDYFTTDKFEEQTIRRRYQEFCHLYRIKKNDRILEIGSGGGQALEFLGKYEISYLPLDISLKNLKQIKELSSLKIFPTAGDAYQLPFTDSSFDLVILSEVLEHLDNPAQALKEIKRILKKGSVLIVSVPYKEKIKYQICIHCNKPTPTNAHLHSFDEVKLKRFIEEAGLMPVKYSLACNKAANRLHFNLLCKKLPFILWKLFDRLFNLIIPKVSYLILIAKK